MELNAAAHNCFLHKILNWRRVPKVHIFLMCYKKYRVACSSDILPTRRCARCLRLKQIINYLMFLNMCVCVVTQNTFNMFRRLKRISRTLKRLSLLWLTIFVVLNKNIYSPHTSICSYGKVNI